MLLGVFALQAHAQTPKGIRFKAAYQINFLSGVNDLPTFSRDGGPVYVVGYMPSMGTGVSVGWSFDRVYVDASYTVNYGITLVEDRCYNQKFDHVLSLNMGASLWRSEAISLDCLLGVGWAVSGFYWINQRLDYSSLLTAYSLVLPVSGVVWFGDTRSEHGRLGVSVEYMVPIASLNHVRRMGYGGKDGGGGIFPSTLGVGVRYQF